MSSLEADLALIRSCAENQNINPTEVCEKLVDIYQRNTSDRLVIKSLSDCLFEIINRDEDVPQEELEKGFSHTLITVKGGSFVGMLKNALKQHHDDSEIMESTCKIIAKLCRYATKVQGEFVDCCATLVSIQREHFRGKPNSESLTIEVNRALVNISHSGEELSLAFVTLPNVIDTYRKIMGYYQNNARVLELVVWCLANLSCDCSEAFREQLISTEGFLDLLFTIFRFHLPDPEVTHACVILLSNMIRTEDDSDPDAMVLTAIAGFPELLFDVLSTHKENVELLIDLGKTIQYFSFADTDFAQSLGRCENCASVFFDIISRHRDNPALVVKMCPCISNMAVDSEPFRQSMATVEGAGSRVLIELLNMYQGSEQPALAIAWTIAESIPENPPFQHAFMNSFDGRGACLLINLLQMHLENEDVVKGVSQALLNLQIHANLNVEAAANMVLENGHNSLLVTVLKEYFIDEDITNVILNLILRSNYNKDNGLLDEPDISDVLIEGLQHHLQSDHIVNCILLILTDAIKYHEGGESEDGEEQMSEGYLQILQDTDLDKVLQHVCELYQSAPSETLVIERAMLLHALLTMRRQRLMVDDLMKGCDPNAIPNEFLCPLTSKVMIDPVLLSDGNCYEREAIEKWFASNHKESPVTNEPLVSLEMQSHEALNAAITEFIQSLFEENQKAITKKKPGSSKKKPSAGGKVVRKR